LTIERDEDRGSADDLTGAFDTGVQFRNWGLQSRFSSVWGCFEALGDVLVVTRDPPSSRNKAYRRVCDRYGAPCAASAEGYTKCRLNAPRQHGAELDAVIEASKADFAFFAPAYPTYGRTTLSGKQLVDNVPVEKTEYIDELGAKTSDVATLIGIQSKRRVGLVNHKAVEVGVESIRGRVESLKREGIEVAVFDALTEKHLIDIARSTGDTRLFVGSAGLASEVPLGLGLRSSKPVLSVCGSTRRISRTQVYNLKNRLGFREVEIGITRLIDGEAELKSEVKRCIGEAVEALKAGVDVSLIRAFRGSVDERVATQAGPKRSTKFFIEEAMVELSVLWGGVLAASSAAHGLMVCQLGRTTPR
jgi:uncharacterized protein YgbK (DUF1537 family)